MNAPLLELLSNWQSKAIYPSYTILENIMSLDKSPDCEFTSDIIITLTKDDLGCCPGKKRSCQQKNVYQTSATTETLAADLSKDKTVTEVFRSEKITQ